MVHVSLFDSAMLTVGFFEEACGGIRVALFRPRFSRSVLPDYSLRKTPRRWSSGTTTEVTTFHAARSLER